MVPTAELALLFASRAQQVQEIILPALAAGKWVLCDRFTDSSEAYQGGGRGLGTEAVLTMHRLVCGKIQPDMTVLMDSEVAASVARARRSNRVATAQGGEADENRFEQENQAFFTGGHDAYLAIARREPHRVLMLDARRQADIVHREIVDAVRQRFLGTAKTA